MEITLPLHYIGGFVKHVLLTLLFVLGLSLHAQAANPILSWDCNPPASPGVGETKEFVIEKTLNGTTTTLGTVPQSKDCTGRLSFEDPAEPPVGTTLFSVYAVSPTGIKSTKATVSKTVTQPPVGPMTATITSIGETTLSFSYTVPKGAKASLRILAPGQGWGNGLVLDCPSSPCKISGLLPNTAYTLSGVPYEGTLGSNSRYGSFFPDIAFKTLMPADPAPPAPTGFTVVDALREASDKCDKLKSCTFAKWKGYLVTAMKKVVS